MDTFKLLKKAINELATRMNPLVQTTAKHLSRVLLTNTSITSVYALHPDIREKVVDLVTLMQGKGKPVYVVQVVRTADEQDFKYEQGRTRAGEIVTYCKGWESPHQYGLAVDVAFKNYSYNPPNESWWEELGAAGESLGLRWGGRWDKLKDRPHFEHVDFEKNSQALKDFFTN